jgi:hypothetical protein
MKDQDNSRTDRLTSLGIIEQIARFTFKIPYKMHILEVKFKEEELRPDSSKLLVVGSNPARGATQ